MPSQGWETMVVLLTLRKHGMYMMGEEERYLHINEENDGILRL